MTVNAVDCDCEEDKHEENCIGVINLRCGDHEAIFDGVVCEGSIQCCGSILNDTSDGHCRYEDGTKAIIGAAEIAAIIFGIVFGLVIGALIYYCYCSKQKLVVQSKNIQTPMVENDGGYGTGLTAEQVKKGKVPL